MGRRKRTDVFFRILATASAAIVLRRSSSSSDDHFWKSAPALSLSMLTRTPKGGFYLGKEGGILNAIVGSLDLALGATVLAFF